MWNRLGYHVCVVCDVCAYSAKNSSGRSKEAGISLLDIERNYGKWTLFSSCFDNWQMLAYVISACEVCIIWWKLIASCRIERKLPNRRPGRSHSTNSAVCMSHKYFEDAKKTGFWKSVKFDLSRSINPPKNRNLKQGILYLWSKFGAPSLNEWWVFPRTTSKWG